MTPELFKYLLLLSFGIVACSGPAERDIASIHGVLGEQVEAWNRGDIRGYMEGYWNDDALVFTGGKQVTHGWQEALERYERAYPDREAMGELSFDDLELKLLDDRAAFTVGEWRLERKVDTLRGRFTLIWRKLKGRWCIVADHSS